MRALVGPSKEEIRLLNIIKNGTEEEKRKANIDLKELYRKEREEREKNPPPWAGIIEF